MINEKVLIEEFKSMLNTMVVDADGTHTVSLEAVIAFIEMFPTIQPQGYDKDKLIEVLTNYFSIGDSCCYNLTRVKEAFAVGTVCVEDFEEFGEETVYDLAEYIIEKCQQSTSNGWIPVSERHPCDKDVDEEGYVLAQRHDGYILKAQYDDYRCLWYDEMSTMIFELIVAWQPLPPAYKESE